MKGFWIKADKEVFSSICEVGVAIFDLVSDLAFDDGEASIILAEPTLATTTKEQYRKVSSKTKTKESKDTADLLESRDDAAADETSLWDGREYGNQGTGTKLKTEDKLVSRDDVHNTEQLRFSRRIRMGSANKAKKYLEVRRQTKQQQPQPQVADDLADIGKGAILKSPSKHGQDRKSSKKQKKPDSTSRHSASIQSEVDEIKRTCELIQSLQQEEESGSGNGHGQVNQGNNNDVPLHPSTSTNGSIQERSHIEKIVSDTHDSSLENRQEKAHTAFGDVEFYERDSAPMDRATPVEATSRDATPRKRNGNRPEVTRSDSLVQCKGIVGERASLWQKHLSSTRVSSSHKHSKWNKPQVVDFDEYVRNFQNLHKQQYQAKGGGNTTRASQ